MRAHIGLLSLALLPVATAFGQSQPVPSESASSGPSNDLFLMFGSDLVRPGLLPKANYNIGLGHTFSFLSKDPIGDEITFAYTYENAGSHGFLHTDFGSHTEALGLMKNFAIPRTRLVTGYTWIQGGITSLTGPGAPRPGISGTGEIPRLGGGGRGIPYNVVGLGERHRARGAAVYSGGYGAREKSPIEARIAAVGSLPTHVRLQVMVPVLSAVRHIHTLYLRAGGRS